MIEVKMKILNYLNGVYQGHVDNQGQLNGLGCFYWRDSQIYYGQWKNNLMEGKGIMVFPQGGYLCGYLKENLVSGQVKIVFPNQDVMYGYCQQGLFQGRFIRKFKDTGKYLECQYERGNLIQICGELTEHEFICKASTEFTDMINMKEFFETSVFYNQDNSTITTENIDDIVYDEFNNQMKCIQINQNELYFGTVKLDIPRGYGVKIHLNANLIQRGRFLDGILNGRGRKNFQNGDIYDGGFDMGAIANSGLFYSNQDLTWISGYFKNNQLVTSFAHSNSPFPPCISDYESFNSKEVDVKKEIASQCIYFTEKEALFMIKSLHQLSRYSIILSKEQNQIKEVIENNKNLLQKQFNQPNKLNMEKKVYSSKILSFQDDNKHKNKQIESDKLDTQPKSITLQAANSDNNKQYVKSYPPPQSRKNSTQDIPSFGVQSCSISMLNSTQPFSSQYNSNSVQYNSNNIALTIHNKGEQFMTQNNSNNQSQYNSNKIDCQQANDLNIDQKQNDLNIANSKINKMNIQRQESLKSNEKNNFSIFQQIEQEEPINQNDIPFLNGDHLIQIQNQNGKQRAIEVQQHQENKKEQVMMPDSIIEDSEKSESIQQKNDLNSHSSQSAIIFENLSINSMQKSNQIKNSSKESVENKSVIIEGSIKVFYSQENCDEFNESHNPSVVILDTARISKSSQDTLSLARTPNFNPQLQQQQQQQFHLLCEQIQLNRFNDMSPSSKKETFPEEIGSFSKLDDFKESERSQVNNNNAFDISQNSNKQAYDLQRINNIHNRSLWMKEGENQFCQVEIQQPSKEKQIEQQSENYSLSISNNYESMQPRELKNCQKIQNKDQQSFSTINFNSNSQCSNMQEEQNSPFKNQLQKRDISSKLKQIVQQQNQSQTLNSQFNQCTIPSEHHIQDTNFTTDQSYSQQQYRLSNFNNQQASINKNNQSFNNDKRFSFNQSEARSTLNITQITPDQYSTPSQNNFRDNQQSHEFSPVSSVYYEEFDNKENLHKQNLQTKQQQLGNKLVNKGNRNKPRVIKIDLFAEQSPKKTIENQSPKYEQRRDSYQSEDKNLSSKKQFTQQSSVYLYQDVPNRLLKDICCQYSSSQNTQQKKQSQASRHRRQFSENNRFYESNQNCNNNQNFGLQNNLGETNSNQRRSDFTISRKQSTPQLLQNSAVKKMISSKSQYLLRQQSLSDLAIKKQNEEISTKILKEISHKQFKFQKSLFQKLIEMKHNQKSSFIL